MKHIQQHGASFVPRAILLLVLIVWLLAPFLPGESWAFRCPFWVKVKSVSGGAASKIARQVLIRFRELWREKAEFFLRQWLEKEAPFFANLWEHYQMLPPTFRVPLNVTEARAPDAEVRWRNLLTRAETEASRLNLGGWSDSFDADPLPGYASSSSSSGLRAFVEDAQAGRIDYRRLIVEVLPAPPETKNSSREAVEHHLREIALLLGPTPADPRLLSTDLPAPERTYALRIAQRIRMLRETVRDTWHRATEDALWSRQTRKWLENLHPGNDPHYAYTQAAKEIRELEKLSIQLERRLLQEEALTLRLQALKVLQEVHDEETDLVSVFRKR
ncbi:hypothetical protein [Thermosulfurimonas sp. F29]|uniref:hypothetical protein n=1 Tax=Thermosulfurimonas sp. F29 TaxID=2867247 RepID=UPI001C834477|nr:hypothetical protein [Thermosulfurimonas sp. F29]MBX6423351.1 hypothetical protein [Thermosulfurimonas sp. F29]